MPSNKIVVVNNKIIDPEERANQVLAEVDIELALYQQEMQQQLEDVKRAKKRLARGY